MISVHAHTLTSLSQSVDAGLNTNAAGIASIMLDSTSYSTVRSLVSRLMLTNLAHETKAKHFSELVQIVMDRFSRLLDAFNEREADPAELFVATQSLAVCVSVRKGKRVDGEYSFATLVSVLTIHICSVSDMIVCRFHKKQAVRYFESFRNSSAAYGRTITSSLDEVGSIFDTNRSPARPDERGR